MNEQDKIMAALREVVKKPSKKIDLQKVNEQMVGDVNGEPDKPKGFLDSIKEHKND